MIDADVHHEWLTIRDLFDWLDPGVRDFMERSNFAMPGALWPNPHHYVRRDSLIDPANPVAPIQLIREQLLDAFDLEFAIVNGGGGAMLLGCMPNRLVAGAIARAWNRWLTEEFLPSDRRLRGSIYVTPQDPTEAAREIRAMGNKPGVVQVLLTAGSTAPYGQPQFHEIFEAAAEVGLPVGIHIAGEGYGINAPLACGHPTYYIEYHTLACVGGMAHTVSLVCHGVFEKYPDLRVAVLETGTLWLPEVFWRLDSNWKALRAEVPWVKRLPSEVIREHMVFGSQPLEEPPKLRQLHQVLEAVDGLDDMLMLCTDYPHWDFDAPDQLLARLPSGWREKVAGENARRFYKLPARVPAAAA